ncbi:MAG: 3-dehydroquinate synthase [Actinobacteria bacterium]|nr:3-dehydroquinate synthase [Actinomycetota bacterium]
MKNFWESDNSAIKIINVQTILKKYQIVIRSGILERFHKVISSDFKDINKIVLVSNDRIYHLYKEKLQKMLEACKVAFEIVIIKDGEKYKSLESAQLIYGKLVNQNIHRNDLIVAFGGGVIGDLVGFVASTFHRGTKLLQFPTTIIGQVDSSIGGKVVVNFDEIKNVIGCFYQPDMVLIDPDLLKTLDETQIINGLAEIVKYGIIFDRNILKVLDENTIGLADERLFELVKSSSFTDLIYECCKIKAKVIEKDEFDTGHRNLLNFGHTIGHAIEKVSKLGTINHGMAVALGMIVALDISENLSILKNGFKDDFLQLYEKLKLPFKIPANLNAEDIISALKFDKKFTDSKNRFVLLKGMNKPAIVENIDEKLIADCIIKNLKKGTINEKSLHNKWPES